MPKPSKPHRDRLERVYVILSGDDRYDRACARIPDSECTDLPRNFVLNVANGAASKLAEQVASAKLTLPWLMSAMGAPAFLIGLVLPLRQAGTLLPQLAISGYIRGFRLRKWFWVCAALVQVVMLLAISAAALFLTPFAAGICIVASLLIFSMARGVGSVAFQDVTGKTIPKGKRGKMLAARSMIGGLFTIAVGFGLKIVTDGSTALQPALILIVGGALLWLLAAVAFGAIREAPGATSGGRNPLAETAAGWQLLRSQPWYRRFLLVRIVLLSIELAGPFYVLYVNALFPNQPGVLATIVIAAGLAGAFSSPVWGRFADLSSRKVLFYSGLLGAVSGAAALGIGLLPAVWRTPYLMAAVFVLLGFSEAGVLLGRKTYLIDRVDAAQRATYVAFANSGIGLVALCFGALGVVVQFVGVQWLLGVFVALGIVGAGLSRRLPEAGDENQ